MDSMTIAKYGGAGCVMLLAYLGLNAVMHDGLFHPEHLETAAYKIETDGEGGGGGAAEPTLPELLAAADLKKGEKVFKKCSACHKVEAGANGVGPSLWNVMGRDIASIDGFGYSGDLGALDGGWTWEQMDAFLTNPKGVAPGTKMGFAGLKKATDRANVMAYLNQAGDAPIEAPAAEAAPVEEAAAAPMEEAATDAAPSDAPAEDAPAEAPVETAAAPAAADPKLLKAGEKAFKKCKACHKLEAGKNGVGPSLHGVVGKDIASVDGFKYSEALTGIDGVWDAANLDAFLAKPKDFAPGTKMAFPGLKKEDDRIAVIAYLSPAGEVAAEAPVKEAAATPTEETAEAPVETAVAEAPAEVDPAMLKKGEKAFKKCKACHKLEAGKNGVGPSLAGIVGADIAAVDGFKYSDALTSVEGVWDAANLDAFLTKPKDFAPGTKMAFPGLKKEADRAALIQYLGAN